MGIKKRGMRSRGYKEVEEVEKQRKKRMRNSGDEEDE